jgi:zinc transport system substrate-binding protein
MKKVNNADIFIYIDESIETFIERPLATLGEDVKKIKILGNAGLKLLPIREGGVWEEEDHGDGHHHDHGDYDGHIWLSNKNAIKLTKFFVKELSKINPDKKNIYKANAKVFIKKLKENGKKIKNQLSSISDKPYIVFHDAYQYFESENSLNSVGSISLNPEISPTPKRIKEIKTKIEKDNVVCLFREPQFPSRIVQTVISETNAKEGELDPLGYDLTPGKNLYFELIDNLSMGLKDCLSNS